jgi:sec-independent protein translocase protein TatA
MFNGPEIWIIILLVVVLFGGSRLPKIARNLGKAQSELKKGLAEGVKEGRNSKNRLQLVLASRQIVCRLFECEYFYFRRKHISEQVSSLIGCIKI